ncbi:MAG TPA: hypothetical protein VN414_01990 [Methanosarcina sp.]|nr:hypothetical protein [Methanosarcina sp.]
MFKTLFSIPLIIWRSYTFYRKRYSGVINRRNGCGTTLFKKLLACKPFQKKVDRKPLATLGFDENLIPKPYPA